MHVIPLLARGRDRLETTRSGCTSSNSVNPLLARGRDRLETRVDTRRRARLRNSPTR